MLRRGGGPIVVALSGLDGCGKSTLAEALRKELTSAGVRTTAAWTKLGGTPWTATVARRLKAGLRLSRPVTATPPRTFPSGAREDLVDSGTLLRRRSRVLTWAWTLVLVGDNIRSHRRAVRASDADVVVCDRWVLDSVVQLRHRYGDRPYRLHVLLLRHLSPAPSIAWVLDVPPAAARARKPEQFDLRQLDALAVLYRAACGHLGVRRVDGEEHPEVLAATLLADVRDLLRSRHPQWGARAA